SKSRRPGGGQVLRREPSSKFHKTNGGRNEHKEIARESSGSNGWKQWNRAGHRKTPARRGRTRGHFRAQQKDVGRSRENHQQRRRGGSGRRGQALGRGQIVFRSFQETWKDRCFVCERRSRQIRSACRDP